MSVKNPAYDRPVEPVASMSHEAPMEARAADPVMGTQGQEDEVEMEIAPLLHSEMEKIQVRTRCQTCSIVTQTVLLVAIGLVIIAGVVVLNFQFENLNAELKSLADTGEMARPLLSEGTQLASEFNNLTDSLSGLGLTGNDSLASGVQDFATTITDAGKQLLGGLTDAIQG